MSQELKKKMLTAALKMFGGVPFSRFVICFVEVERTGCAGFAGEHFCGLIIFLSSRRRENREEFKKSFGAKF